MNVIGSGRIVPPIKTAANGDLLFYVQSDRASIQVRAPQRMRAELCNALVEAREISVAGELVSFRGRTGGSQYVVVLG